MADIEKIVQLFDALQEGDCWIGLNLQQVVQEVNAQLAVTKINQRGNTIWQMLNHLIFWRKTVLIRLQGKNELPSMPDMYLPDDLSEASWQNTLQHFEEVYKELRNGILSFDEALLDSASPVKGQTYYQLLMGCLQHDSYHMGQMVLLKKQLT